MERRFYQLMPAATQQKPVQVLQEDYVVPDGVTVEIQSMGGSAGTEDGCTRIVWDDETILVTYWDTNHLSSYTILGDGVKKLSIILTSAGLSPQWMGGYWTGGIK